MLTQSGAAARRPNSEQRDRGATKNTILVASHRTDTYPSLARMLHDCDLEVAAVDSFALSLVRLRRPDVSVVICERDLPVGGWKAVLAAIETTPAAPLLIVTAPDADEKLWAEVLNLGGHDVLAQPLDRAEVQRVLLHAHRLSCGSRPRRSPS